MLERTLETSLYCLLGGELEERAGEDNRVGGEDEGGGQGEGLPQQTTQPEPAAG